MKVTLTEVPGLLVLQPQRFEDNRGFFEELYSNSRYAELGIRAPFVQDNFSRSSRGVLRGLHLQNPNAQGKLVSIVRGAILDIAVDVRIGSPAFGRHVSMELSEENHCQLYLPRGCAHGFVVLSDSADFLYKCDAYYSPKDELVIRWDDPALAIDWRVSHPAMSPRDAQAPLLADVRGLPLYEA
jgi:dTDP-4-dehydrorhamnose 3,5-epimerase